MTIVGLEELGHSGRNLIDPSSQDNVVIQRGFFQHIYHVGCAFNLHSIINNGLIPGGQNSSKRQTVFFLPVVPRDKGHKDPEKIDLNVSRHAQYLHSAWKKHQDAIYWVDIDVAIRKGLTFYQTRSNAIILQGILPAYCIPKVVRLKTGEVLYDKVYMPPRPPPKISLKHEWKRELGSEVVRQPEGQVARLAKFFQPTQPTPNPIRCTASQHEHLVLWRSRSVFEERWRNNSTQSPTGTVRAELHNLQAWFARICAEVEKKSCQDRRTDHGIS